MHRHRARLNRAFLAFLLAPLAASAGLEMSAATKGMLEHVGAWEKDATAFNPGGSMVDAGIQDVHAVLQTAPSITRGPLQARAEVWALLGNDGVGHEDVLVSEAAVSAGPFVGAKAAFGLKRVYWGSAYSWNPSNPFGDRDANNTDRLPAYRRRGLPFLEGELSGAAYSLKLLALDDDRGGGGEDDFVEEAFAETRRFFDRADYAARLELFFDRADVGITAARYRDSPFLGASLSSSVGEALALHAEGAFLRDYLEPRAQAVPTPAGEGFTLGTVEEKTGWQAVVGGQYTTAFQMNLLLEYLYNGTGLDRDGFDALLAAAERSRAGLGGSLDAMHRGFLASANSLPGFLRRHYAFARLGLDRLPLEAKVGLYARACLEEAEDVMMGGSLAAPLADNLHAKVYGEWFPDGDRSETGLIPLVGYLAAALTFTF